MWDRQDLRRTRNDRQSQVSTVLIKEAVPHFGSTPMIVKMSNLYARSEDSACLVYTACNGAMEVAIRSLSCELGRKNNVTVNCVSPEPVDTSLWAKTIKVQELAKIGRRQS